ncbi:hypothetical protein L6452_09789 [Arctium lappa]|uniref:Uncharacterized protein n=1 Tax=Arctium lappa TaxID=4217 RepID=A0ACB9DLH2_ARCLA|nr:hypothetical protein L6452_09789 [Arctium lappa]
MRSKVFLIINYLLPKLNHHHSRRENSTVSLHHRQEHFTLLSLPPPSRALPTPVAVSTAPPTPYAIAVDDATTDTSLLPPLELLKETTKRKGWLNHGIKGPESIAIEVYESIAIEVLFVHLICSTGSVRNEVPDLFNTYIGQKDTHWSKKVTFINKFGTT